MSLGEENLQRLYANAAKADAKRALEPEREPELDCCESLFPNLLSDSYFREDDEDGE